MKKHYILFIFTLLIFVSCDRRERLTDRDLEREEEERPEGEREDCFNYVYPITYTTTNGESITGDDEASVRLALRTWYANNPDLDERPQLEYPVDVIYNGETISIEQGEGLRRLYAACYGGEEEREPCFDLVYPISYTMPDGSIVSSDNETEAGLAIRAWYGNNTGVEGEPTMQYPVDVVFEDGTSATAEDGEDLRAIYASCDDE